MTEVNNWMESMLGEQMERFRGKWTVIFAGEMLKGVSPIIDPDKTMVFPNTKKSCGANGGGYIFNSGEGFSVLSCSRELYTALSKHFSDHGAWVHCYNAGVWFDTADNRIQKMEAMCHVSDHAYDWMKSMLGDQMQEFAGLWVDIAAGETLFGVPPMIEADKEMVFPHEKLSCGYNGGGYIFNSGEGFSVLSCSRELYTALSKHFSDHGAWVHCYNAGVWFDTADNRIQKMEAMCRVEE